MAHGRGNSLRNKVRGWVELLSFFFDGFGTFKFSKEPNGCEGCLGAVKFLCITLPVYSV